MEILGIEFAPLNVSLKRRIQTLSVATAFFCLSYLLIVGICISIYLLFSRYLIIVVLYLLWIFVIDSVTPQTGGRRVEWIRSLPIFKHAMDYYPMKIHVKPGYHLDNKRNYIMAAFPHGVLAQGPYLTFGARVAGGFHEICPSFTHYCVTLKQSFFIPIYREFLLAMGFISASATAINYVLSQPEGGSIVGIIVGGATEAFSAVPGQHHVVLKNRKGFIKLALINGSPIIPVYSFGETDLFRQLCFPKGSIIRSFQEFIKETFGFAPILFMGRGFFQYTFGALPLRTPVNVIVGEPLEVRKTVNPSKEDIDELHQRFMDALKSIFDEYKYKFIENPEEVTLTIS